MDIYHCTFQSYYFDQLEHRYTSHCNLYNHNINNLYLAVYHAEQDVPDERRRLSRPRNTQAAPCSPGLDHRVLAPLHSYLAVLSAERPGLLSGDPVCAGHCSASGSALEHRHRDCTPAALDRGHPRLHGRLCAGRDECCYRVRRREPDLSGSRLFPHQEAEEKHRQPPAQGKLNGSAGEGRRRRQSARRGDQS